MVLREMDLTGLGVGVVLGGFVLMSGDSFTPFEATVFSKEGFRKVNVDSNFYKNLEGVLNYYQVEFKRDESGVILIKNSLSKDKELIMNYTNKAIDSLWLKFHDIGGINYENN